MVRFIMVATALLSVGCVANRPEQAVDQRTSACPSRHTLACDVSARTGEIVPGSCSCIRNSDLNSMLRPSAFGSARAFRSRIRN